MTKNPLPQFLIDEAEQRGYRFEMDPDGTIRMIRPDGTVAIIARKQIRLES